MIVENKTHYFGEYTRMYNCLPDPDSFSVQSSKRMGYFQRLWFEYAYCRKVNGMCFYYTLTYNDLHIPKYRGRNCFSYEDIRYVTNGSLSKTLLRKYGSVLRYFCACESGEGKGERGLGNNPHYHFIFFVYPSENSKFEYKKITPQEFKDLIYVIWQGKPSNVFVPWQLAKFGHVQEGKFNGEVLSADAFKYCGKYVIKDSEQLSYERDLKKELESEIRSYSFNWKCLYSYYKYLKCVDSEIRSRSDFFDYLPLRQYWSYRLVTKRLGLVPSSFSRYLASQGQRGFIKYKLLLDWFDNYYVPQMLEEQLSEYRNLYSPKCRLSKTLGEYGLNFIQLIDGSPRVVLNTSKGYEIQYPCLYYIRKLFYDVKLCPVTGNPLYYLNDYGIKMKLMSLKNSINNCISHTLENISYCQMNNVVIPFGDSPDGFTALFNKFVQRDDISEIVRRYAVFHLIYQYRAFSKPWYYLDQDCKEDDYILDYDVFLHQNSYYLDFQDGKIYDIYIRNMSLSFTCHPAFIEFSDFFRLLDSLNEIVDSEVSYNRKKQFSEKSRHVKRLNAYRFNCSFPFVSVELPVETEVPSVLPIYEQLSLFA